MVDTSNYEKVVSAIEKKYNGSVQKGNAFQSVERIPFKSLELNLITRGGIPLGRISRLYGGPSSCKSLTAWDVIECAQAMGLTCAYYNIEKQYDVDFLTRYRPNIDTDKLLIINGTTIEETGAKLESLLEVVHVHVLDSCSNAVSIDELNSDVEQWHRGLNARAWGKVMRRVGKRLDNTDNAVIMIDQVRIDMGTGSENPPGGKLMEHSSSMTLYFKRGKWLWRSANGGLTPDLAKGDGNTGISGAAEPAGYEVKVRCHKSRVSPPLKTATLNLDFETMAFDPQFELIKSAKHFGYVGLNGAWYTIPNGKKPIKVQGEKGLREYINDNPEWADAVKEQVLIEALENAPAVPAT